MKLTFARITYDPVVFQAITLEVLHLEDKYDWTINAHQQQASFQSGYWCSVENLTLGREAGRGSTVLGRGNTLDEALADLASQLSNRDVTIYKPGEGYVWHRLPALVHTLRVTL